MKKVILLAVICLFAAIQTAHAHAPSDIDLDYNPATKTLTVVVHHPAADGKTHYVAQIDIAVNGERVIKQNIKLQDDKNMQSLTYRLPDVSMEDRIEVEASCNVNGSRTKMLVVE
ncbi:hypothetical protein ACFL5C_00455 [Candidatus Omnitrophota bacterium]